MVITAVARTEEQTVDRAPRPAVPPATGPTAPGPVEAAPPVPHDADSLALAARSIASCPADLELLVDGAATALGEEDTVGLADPHGEPTFSCHVDSALADAAELGRSVLVTLTSGIGPVGGPDRGTDLVLAGRLHVLGTDHCACCAETRVLVGISVSTVLLTRRGSHGDVQQRVPVEQYRSTLHQLNIGFLQRSVEHANDAHQDELRRAVSVCSGTHLRDVLGVRLTGLSNRGVEVSWVDPTGAHRTLVDFPSPARTPAELGELLRRSLHAGLC